MSTDKFYSFGNDASRTVKLKHPTVGSWTTKESVESVCTFHHIGINQIIFEAREFFGSRRTQQFQLKNTLILTSIKQTFIFFRHRLKKGTTASEREIKKNTRRWYENKWGRNKTNSIFLKTSLGVKGENNGSSYPLVAVNSRQKQTKTKKNKQHKLLKNGKQVGPLPPLLTAHCCLRLWGQVRTLHKVHVTSS